MTTLTPEYRSAYNRTLFAEGKAEGRAEGEAKAIMTVLESREFALSAEDRARIAGCTDSSSSTSG